MKYEKVKNRKNAQLKYDISYNGARKDKKKKLKSVKKLQKKCAQRWKQKKNGLANNEL